DAPDGRKVKATLHWVSAKHALNAELRLYNNLFDKENPEEVEEGGDFTKNISPDSLEILDNCKLEPFLKDSAPGDKFQFERQGYFCVDTKFTDKLTFNRTVTLKDTWAKLQKKN
ncbi:MAG: glutamine--tRNA ligase, partial [Bacteroidota bacterium]